MANPDSGWVIFRRRRSLSWGF